MILLNFHHRMRGRTHRKCLGRMSFQEKKNLGRAKKRANKSDFFSLLSLVQVGNTSESNIWTRDDSWQASLALCKKQSVLDWTLANTIRLEREIILFFFPFCTEAIYRNVYSSLNAKRPPGADNYNDSTDNVIYDFCTIYEVELAPESHVYSFVLVLNTKMSR